MANFVKYVKETGKIHSTGTCSLEDVHLQADDIYGTVIATANYNTDYVKDGAVVIRPSISVNENNLRVNETLQIECPEDTTVFIDDEKFGVTDSDTLELVFTEKGTWLIKLEPPFPFLGISFEAVVK